MTNLTLNGGSGGLTINNLITLASNGVLTLNTTGTATQGAALTVSGTGGLLLLGSGRDFTLTTDQAASHFWQPAWWRRHGEPEQQGPPLSIGAVGGTNGVTAEPHPGPMPVPVTHSQAIAASNLLLLGLGGSFNLSGATNAVQERWRRALGLVR